jgi:predicted TIM-barrel fold metal-dependent hydrolase
MAPVFDCHLHIIDPRFPLIRNQGFLPRTFTVPDYLAAVEGLGITGGAIVSGSFQGFDQSYLLEALETLGTGFVGVTQLPDRTTDEDIVALDRAGVRALRFNLFRGGSETLEHLTSMAARVHELAGWHVELYVDGKDLPSLRGRLSALPAVSIDHLGLSAAGENTLLDLAEHGVHIKATGFGRLDFDIARRLENIHRANPQALMFGTDLPGTRAPRAFQTGDMDLIVDTLGEKAANDVLYHNARRFYRLD